MRASVRLLALLFAIACATPAFTQTPAPVQAALDKARATMVVDPDEGLQLSLAAETLAAKMPAGNDRRIAVATARWLRSEAYLRQDNVKAAAPLIAMTLRDIPETIKLRGDLLLSLGSLQMDDGKAARALDSYLEALRIFRRLGEKRSESLAENYLAGLYSAGNAYQMAVDHYELAMTAYSADPALSLILHNNRGNALLLLDKYQDADAEYAQALKLAQQIHNTALEAYTLSNIARNQLEWGHLDEAQKALDRGFALTRDSGITDQRRFMLATAARVAADRKNFPLAERLIRECFKGVDLATTSGPFRTPHLYAYQIFSATGQLKLALMHLEAVRRITDESSKVATTTGAAIAAARYNSEGQKAQIATMQADAATKSAAFQRTLFLSIGVATLIVIAALAWGLVTIRRSRNKVAAANVVLGETNVALEKALKAKTEFLATTSHEIRTPLNGILGMTQVMLHDQKLDAATRDRIGIVHGAGVTMRSLVDDILDVAKMETGNLVVDARPMDLCAMLKEVTRLWDEQARAKGLAFNLHLSHAPHWIVSDAGRLRQIVFNLLSNAIKFTEKGGVSLRVVAEGEGEAGRLKLAVTDTGIGIPAAKREEIFESFKQADSGTTRQFGGTGLGLTICRNLARALGGDIHVEGGEGRGSVFVVDLPLVPAEAPEAEATSGASGTMLVLDRNPIARSMLKTLLEPRVGALRFLATPDEALAALADPGASHLVIDEGTLKAAGDDPFSILARLAAAAADAGALSAILWLRPDPETRAAILGSGITQVIEKPVAGASLIEALIPAAQENSDEPGSGPLVSRAA
jgi:signal transduction histidine kinase/CheY-like chemotaxis protein